MLQTANVLKSNFTQPIGCRVLVVKCSKDDHLNLEACTRQLSRMMDLMPSDFAAAVNSTLPASAMIPNQQNFTRHDERFNFSTIFSDCQISSCHFQERSSAVTFILKFFPYRIVNLLNISCFHRTLGISPKDLERFKADIAFIYTTLACSLTI